MPIYHNDNWDVASLFDAAGNVIQFNTLVTPDTGFEHEGINQVHTSGDYQSGFRDLLMLSCSDMEGEDQLAAWKAAKTPVQAVALSPAANGRNYRWPSWTKLKEALSIEKAVRSEGDSYLKTVLEDFDVSPFRSRNLLFGVTGTTMLLPVAGVTLTLAAEKGSAFTLDLTAYDFEDTELDTVTANFDDERGSVSLLLPATTWSIEWSLDGGTSASLRLDGSSTYIAG